MLTTAASETMTLKDSTRCLLDRPADGYNKQIQTETDEKARRRAEQSRAKKTPDRRDPKQTEELAELAELEKTILRVDRQTVKRRDTASKK
jgi:hypothetical protein